MKALTWNNRTKAIGIVAAAAVIVGAGLALTQLGDDETTKREKEYAVAYRVTGDTTVTIHYGDAKKPNTPAREAREVKPPWSKEVQVTRSGGRPSITITLGSKGGQAQCHLSMAGRDLQHATATGKFGRATCTTELPPADEQPN